MVNVFSMIVACQLKQDIKYTNSQEIIGNVIAESMLYDKDIKQLHYAKGFKNYVFNNFYPIEKEGTYKKNNVYTFIIRSLNKNFLKRIITGLERSENPYLKILAISRITRKKDKYVNDLYTFTPAITTISNEENKTEAFILEKHGIKLLQTRIVSNLEKKYKSYYNEEIISKDFIQGIELSKNPIITKYKGKSLLGYKIKLTIGSSYEAQELAKIALASGILEKNSCLGAGFVEAH